MDGWTRPPDRPGGVLDRSRRASVAPGASRGPGCRAGTIRSERVCRRFSQQLNYSF